MNRFKDFVSESKQMDPLTLGQISSSFSKGLKDLRSVGSKPVAIVGSNGRDYVLGSLSSYDKKEYKNMKKPPGTEIYRYTTPTASVSGQAPIVAVNMDKGFLYFMTDESSDGDNPEFGTRVDFRAKYVRKLTGPGTFNESVEDISEGTKTVKMPQIAYDEIYQLEVDTTDNHSPDGKKKLADAIESNSIKKGRVVHVTMDDAAYKYLMKSAIPNAIDISKDQGNSRIVRQLQKISEEVAANSTGSVGVSANDVKNIGPRKKRKHRILTRNYIEVMGKRKRQFPRLGKTN